MRPGGGGTKEITSGRQGAHHPPPPRAAASPGASGTWERARQPGHMPAGPTRLGQAAVAHSAGEETGTLVGHQLRTTQPVSGEPGFRSSRSVCSPRLGLSLCPDPHSGPSPAHPNSQVSPVPSTEGGDVALVRGWSWGTSWGNPSFTDTQLGSLGVSVPPGWEEKGKVRCGFIYLKR